MPRYDETSTLLKRGDQHDRLVHNYGKCVSNCFGIQNYGHNSSRTKRDLDSVNLDVDTSLPKRRVVKKLIRVQPIYNSLGLSNKNSSVDYEDSSLPSTTRKRYRKRVVIKKRKKRPRPTETQRRTVVVTKKRLLGKTTMVFPTPEVTRGLPELSTKDVYESEANTKEDSLRTVAGDSFDDLDIPDTRFPEANFDDVSTPKVNGKLSENGKAYTKLLETDTKLVETDTKLVETDTKLMEDDAKFETDAKLIETDTDDPETGTQGLETGTKGPKTGTKLLETNTKRLEVDTKLSKTDSEVSVANTKHLEAIAEVSEVDKLLEKSTKLLEANSKLPKFGKLPESSTKTPKTHSMLLEANKDSNRSLLIDTTKTLAEFPTKTLPHYEPFFPELSESFDDSASVVLLKTTVLTSVEHVTKTVVQSKLRTYTFVVTRVSGTEQIVTSTTEVRFQTKTLTVTEPRTSFTTLTLLDLDATDTLPFVPLTVGSSPTLDTAKTKLTNTRDEDGHIFEEARYNLATRIMSNGVEVIVASDKSTLPGEPDVKRILPSSIYKPVTLKPSTLSDHMMMLLPPDATNADSLSSSLYLNQFVTKTCLTTFTYLTTYLENGLTRISSHEQVVSNIATEERNSMNVIPTPSMGITLTQHPNLAVGTFLTTYTYLNTILDGEQPLVVTSKHTVTNTVTAPEDYLSLMQPPKKASAVKDTNTYYSTLSLQKTLFEGKKSKVISTNEVVTQVVITESVPPKATSVMTSYIALDFEDGGYNTLSDYTTTDVVKTYYVTYTYFNTLLENGQTIVKTNVSTSSDVVTEKLFLHPKRTNSIINTLPIKEKPKKEKLQADNLKIHATKTYVTTFTYFTTLLQENKNDAKSTVVNSHTREVENVVTETISPSLLDKKFLDLLHDEFEDNTRTVTKLATFNDGSVLEVTAALGTQQIKPTKVLPIEKTQMVQTSSTPIIESSNPNVVTGSTIIFFDEIDQIDTSKKPTPSLTSKTVKATKTSLKNGLGSLLSSEIVKKSVTLATKEVSKKQSPTRIPGSKPFTQSIPDPPKKKTPGKTPVGGATGDIPDLLGLGSINMDTFQALTPVINAMAGLIKTNLKPNRKNDTFSTTPNPKFEQILERNRPTSKRPPSSTSPIYIPLGAEEGLEIAESQNVATIHINEWEDESSRPHKDQVVIGKPTHESPLLNGGIPISPGQVITANSDVIVGKPGRIGPRIPSIPLQNDEVVDMKPPPLQSKIWPKRHNDKFNEQTNGAVKNEKDDYLGPPPPLPNKVPLRPSNFVRGEKHKIIDRKRVPLPQTNQEPNRIPLSYPADLEVQVENQPHPQVVIPQIVPVQIPLEAPTLILAQPINDFNIQPSVLNEPIVLPEVIERSTGQPLLVNLQPSQVAFVNIPHNRTTALIYGGSTEPHRNGQYFDDPSPYPEPEFSGIEKFSNGVPQYASVYDEGNQKQVGGVIKVGTDVINNNPLGLPSTNAPQIRPSKPINTNINVNVPPISFGMVQHGADIDAHIINHGDIQFSPPPASFEVLPNQEQPSHRPNPIPISHEEDLRPPEPPRVKPNVFGPVHKKRVRPKPGLPDFLTPPQFGKFPPRPHIPVKFEGHYPGGGHQQIPVNLEPEVSNLPKPEIGNGYELEKPGEHGVRKPDGYGGQKLDGYGSQESGVYGLQKPEDYGQQVPEIYGLQKPELGDYGQKSPELGVPAQRKPEHGVYGHQPELGVYGQQNTGLGGHGQQNPELGVPAQQKPEHGAYGHQPELGVYGQQNAGLGGHGQQKPEIGVYGHQKPELGVYDHQKPELGLYGHQKPGVYSPQPPELGVYNQQKPEFSIHHPQKPDLPGLHTLDIPIYPQQKPEFSIYSPHKPELPMYPPHKSERPVHPLHNLDHPIHLPHNPGLAVYPPHKLNVPPHKPDLPMYSPLKPELYAPHPEIPIYTQQKPYAPQKPLPIPLIPESINDIPNKHDLDVEPDTHTEDDFANEAGEVIQESNPRPLRPGQVPLEVLRVNTTTAEVPAHDFNNNTIRFPDAHNVNFGIQVAGYDNEVPVYHKPSVQEPRPFGKPEQSNQIIPQEPNYFATTQNIYEYATKQPQVYVGSPAFGSRLPPSLVHKTQTEAGDTFTKPAPQKPTTHQSYGIVEVVPVGQKRPYITSMPVNPPHVTSKPSVNIYEYASNFGSQTEAPFDSSLANQRYPVNFVNATYFNHQDVIAQSELATSKPIQEPDMEIMKPPPPPEPATGMEPPRIEVHSPGGGIHRVPNLNLKRPVYDLESQASSPSPYAPRPDDGPPKAQSDEVMGLSPPPQVTTHRPILHFNPNASSQKPVFSLELDPPKTDEARPLHPYIFEVPTSTPATTRRRRPFTRRPLHRKTTTESVTTRRKSVSPVYVEVSSRNRTTTTERNEDGLESEFKETTIVPSATKAFEGATIGLEASEIGLEFDAPTTRVRSSTIGATNGLESLQNGAGAGASRTRLGSSRTKEFSRTRTEPSRTRLESTRTRLESTRIRLEPTRIRLEPTRTRLEPSGTILEPPGTVLEPSKTRPEPPSTRLESPHIGFETSLTYQSELEPSLGIGVPNTKQESSRTRLTPSRTRLDFSTNLVGPQTVVLEEATPDYTRTAVVEPSASKPSIVRFTPGVHHSGNEIKIIDDASVSGLPSSTIQKVPGSTTKTLVPTRYITHTKTSTVTITKTTVVKTLGGPPSTMTILVTKTEKSTKVDTVTEFHTLVQPTSIVETVTTTVNQVPTTLYPPDAPYEVYTSILPTTTHDGTIIATSTSTSTSTSNSDDLDEYIIHDVDAIPSSKPNASIHVPSDNDSIFVVMTDQKHGDVIPVPDQVDEDSFETQNRDEVPAGNEVNRVLLGGILIASPPSLDASGVSNRPDKCNPECKASKNELCQKVEGVMRCVCRPGFARMFPDRPCKPTYTYDIKLGLERHGKDRLHYEDALADGSSPDFNQLATVTHEGLDRMVMQSDLRDIYHGVHVHKFEPITNQDGLVTKFYLQLSDNTDENRLKEIFKKYLRNNNYSLGGTELYASKGYLESLSAEDFDECTNPQFHDCSEHAYCFNLPGTYTCSCKEGFSDLSENSLYPGRICSAELIGCEKCHYHGTCYSRGEDQVICECFQWYAGEHCHINLKVLLIALVTIGTLLFALLLVCIILTCNKKKPRNAGIAAGMSFMPQKFSNHNARRATLDRRAMIQDTSSEGSQSDTNTLPYVAKKPKRQPKGALKRTTDLENGNNTTLSFGEQKDRSLTVMIPRAKYHPAPPTSPLLNMDKRKNSAASSNEAKLLSYLDAGPSPSKIFQSKRKYSNTPSDSFQQQHHHEKPRKISGGALVSAGFEVSATVGGVMGTMGTIGTTCGTEADRSENATLIQKISADLLSSTGTMSQFTTFRKSLVDTDTDDPLSNWLDITPKVTTTVSEARSYDETTIQPPTKSFRNGFDSKPSSQHQNDEANTMAERDVGSTFLLPHTHLYKPDRGSDISGFDSL